MGWQLDKFEMDEAVAASANFFLSRRVDGALEEYEFAGHFGPPGITVLDMGRTGLNSQMLNVNMFIHAEAAIRGHLDVRLLPIDLSLLPIQATTFLISEEMEKRGRQDLAGLVTESNFSVESSKNYRSEVALVCVAELHAAYIGSPKNELVSNFAASIPMDAPLRREIIGLSASQLADSCNLVLSESEFRSTAEKDSLLPIWEADMNDLIERLSG